MERSRVVVYSLMSKINTPTSLESSARSLHIRIGGQEYDGGLDLTLVLVCHTAKATKFLWLHRLHTCVY